MELFDNLLLGLQTAMQFDNLLYCLIGVVIAAIGSRESRFLEIILFGLAMTVAAILLFVKVLALPVPIWPL